MVLNFKTHLHATLPGYFKFIHQGAGISLFLIYRKFPVKKVFGRYKVRSKESPGPISTWMGAYKPDW